MTTPEFINCCAASGYCNKKQAAAWCKKNPSDDYTYDDMIAVYRYFNSNPHGGYNPGWHVLPDFRGKSTKDCWPFM